MEDGDDENVQGCDEVLADNAFPGCLVDGGRGGAGVLKAKKKAKNRLAGAGLSAQRECARFDPTFDAVFL